MFGLEVGDVETGFLQRWISHVLLRATKMVLTSQKHRNKEAVLLPDHQLLGSKCDHPCCYYTNMSQDLALKDVSASNFSADHIGCIENTANPIGVLFFWKTYHHHHYMSFHVLKTKLLFYGEVGNKLPFSGNYV